ncbi:hypothetical protein POM88_015992 [Heracleum sosnowskyi]|uniref:Uncharacterized protein n=1 Tax=Heracleum sosnowskyi TaxID=360622 RepID=A0AAD8MWP9_9APIA|nr:hypothetical protein POM88_015992 [Heracleum sosnowskyi]
MDRMLVFLQFKEALSQNKVRLTLEERNVLMESTEHARRAFWIGFSVAGFAVWLGTRRLRNVLQLPYEGDLGKSFRLSFTITSAIAGGGYGIQHSFGSSFEHILNQEGTQIQRELGNVLVSFIEKFPRENENIMKYVSKHFYLEKVFDDLSTDVPKQVWRYRNFFGDGASTSQRTSQSGSYSENTNVEPKPITVDNSISAIYGVQRRDSFSNKESSTDNDTMADPFGWNVPERDEDTEDAASSTMSRRRHKRNHKRSHRRLMSRREASTNMQHALVDKGMASI